MQTATKANTNIKPGSLWIIYQSRYQFDGLLNTDATLAPIKAPGTWNPILFLIGLFHGLEIYGSYTGGRYERFSLFKYYG
jgi:hypothetical protein